jgi:hypothetical protein
VYCPTCGVVLESRWDGQMQRDVLCCVPPDDMPLSASLTAKLKQRFGPQARADAPQSPLPVYTALLHSGLCRVVGNGPVLVAVFALRYSPQ